MEQRNISNETLPKRDYMFSGSLNTVHSAIVEI